MPSGESKRARWRRRALVSASSCIKSWWRRKKRDLGSRFWIVRPTRRQRFEALCGIRDCRTLTKIPIRDWAQCEAVPSTLSALVAAIVLGHLRQMNTVFKVWGLQVMGVSSVRSETDEWVLKSCSKCKKGFSQPALVCLISCPLLPKRAPIIIKHVNFLCVCYRLMRMLPWSHAWLREPPLLTLTANVPWCSTTTFSRRSCRRRTTDCRSHSPTQATRALPCAMLCAAPWSHKSPQKTCRALCRLCRAVLLAKAALSRLWMCSKWTTTWVCFAQGSWALRRRGCSLPSTTSSFRTKKLNKIHSRPPPCE